MTDRPMPFSGPMVRALLLGRKTQTRRVLKPQPGDGATHFRSGTGKHIWDWPGLGFGSDPGKELPKVPYAPGDRLWVKEGWRACSQMDPLKPSAMSQHEPRRMEADGALIEPACMMIHPGRFRHARFMPRWASRLTLTVTDVMVQRLQEISEENAIAEGCGWSEDWEGFTPCPQPGDGRYYSSRSAISSFDQLWNSIHGPDAWDANRWVCALTFTLEQRNIDQ